MSEQKLAPFSVCGDTPEEDVPGSVAGIGMHQLLLQLFKGTVVDVDREAELTSLTGALLRNLSAHAVVDFCLSWFRELNPLFFTSI